MSYNQKNKSMITMKLNNKNNVRSIIMIVALIGLICPVSGDRFIKRNNVGGLRDPMKQNSGEIDSIGRFAVQQYNKNEDTFLEYTRVVKAKEQVVAGKMYHLTLEAIDGGRKKIYDAKVWVKPWQNFKQLEEFEQAHVITPSASSTSSDIGVYRGN